MNLIRAIILLFLVASPLFAYRDFETSVSWEAFGSAGPQAPRISSVSWRVSDDFSMLAVKNPDTGIWSLLRYQGTQVRGATTGVMFTATSLDGRRISVTIFRKGGDFTYSLTVIYGSKEHMLYGRASPDLFRCYMVPR